MGLVSSGLWSDVARGPPVSLLCETHMVRMSEKSDACRILVGQPLERPRKRRELLLIWSSGDRRLLVHGKGPRSCPVAGCGVSEECEAAKNTSGN
jgi:hypothetical protein